MLDSNKFLFEALTYDDVLLLPAYSEVLPREVSTQSRLTRNISLNIPIVSAAMDTVTEAALAIALAQEGGIGIIHKNMTIDQQAAQVRKVNCGVANSANGVWGFRVAVVDDPVARVKPTALAAH